MFRIALGFHRQGGPRDNAETPGVQWAGWPTGSAPKFPEVFHRLTIDHTGTRAWATSLHHAGGLHQRLIDRVSAVRQYMLSLVKVLASTSVVGACPPFAAPHIPQQHSNIWTRTDPLYLSRRELTGALSGFVPSGMGE